MISGDVRDFSAIIGMESVTKKRILEFAGKYSLVLANIYFAVPSVVDLLW